MGDLQDFNRAFFDTCSGMLDQAEAALARLTPGNPDLEDADTVYRVVLAIAGACSVNGFPEITDFARDFESVMGDVRSGAAPITDELVATLNRALGMLRKLLAHGREGGCPLIGFPNGGQDTPILTITGNDRDELSMTIRSIREAIISTSE